MDDLANPGPGSCRSGDDCGGGGVEPLPPLIAYYAEAWPKLMCLMQATLSQVSALEAQEPVVRVGGSGNGLGWQCANWSSVRNAREHVLKAIVSFARQHFGIAGVEAPLSDYAASTLVDDSVGKDEWGADFDIEGVWKKLERELGRGAGASRALRDAAERARSMLTMEESRGRRDAPQRFRDGWIFECFARLEKRYRGGYEVSYHTKDNLVNLMRDLAVLTSDEAHDIQVPTYAAQFLWNALGGEVSSRQRIQIAGLQLTLFKEKVTVWMSEARALALRAAIEKHSMKGGDEN